MKILIVTAEQLRQDERYTDDKGWAFKNSFERLGVQTETFIYRKKGTLAFLEKKKHIKDLWRTFMNKKLIMHVRRSSPDILMLSRAETVLPETLRLIRKSTQTIIINVFTDNPLYMGNFDAIEPCHCFFVKDTYVLDALKKVGLKNVFYLPQCTNPDICKPMVLSGQEKKTFSSEISLIGSMYPYRLKLLEEIADLNLGIWGKGWEKAADKRITMHVRGGDIRGSKKTMAINGSAISLNPHHPLNDIKGTNSRTFDIAACKSFMLTDYKEDIDDLLKIDKEVICYRTPEELKDLVQYYLKNPAERMKVAEAAYRRVLRDHTYDNRAREILDIAKKA